MAQRGSACYAPTCPTAARTAANGVVDRLVDDLGFRAIWLGDGLDAHALTDALARLWFQLAFRQGWGGASPGRCSPMPTPDRPSYSATRSITDDLFTAKSSHKPGRWTDTQGVIGKTSGVPGPPAA
jgi:hypothetical protein